MALEGLGCQKVVLKDLGCQEVVLEDLGCQEVVLEDLVCQEVVLEVSLQEQEQKICSSVQCKSLHHPRAMF